MIRGQETVGAYVDDTTITTALKGRYVDNKDVDATSIRVETLNGTVMLSGFAKNGTEKSTAEAIARKVNGVKSGEERDRHPAVNRKPDGVRAR